MTTKTTMKLLRLGSQCNNSCIFCARQYSDKADSVGSASRTEDAQRSTEDLFEAISGMVPVEVLGLLGGVLGGEPTLREDLPAIVSGAKHLGATSVVLRTNARRLAYARYAQRLADVGVDGLDVGMHGSSAAMHDYHTAVSGSFAQTVAGIRHAVAAGMRVALCCVVTRSNFRHLEEVVMLGKALRAVVVQFRFPEIAGRTIKNENRFVAHCELVLPYLKRAQEKGRCLGISVMVDPCLLSSDSEVRVARGVDIGTDSVVVAKANPARTEFRGRERRSADDLRSTLPLLFFEKAGVGDAVGKGGR